MPALSSCPRCRTPLQIPDTLLGQKIACPLCRAVFLTSPAVSAPPPPVPTAAISAARPPALPPAVPPAQVIPPHLIREGPPRLARKEEKSPRSRGPILAASIVGVLCLVGGGIAVGLLLSSREPEPPPVAKAPVSQPQDKPAKKPAPAPKPKEAAAEAAGNGSLPRAVLKKIKDATVFIKVEAGSVAGSGSGFVIGGEADAVYVVTNNHVVNPTFTYEPPERLVPRPRLGPRLGRRPPMRLPSRGPVKVTVRNAKITAVFRSGNAREQLIPGTVIGTDAEHDLALIRVANVQNPPAPIDCAAQIELFETMPVYVFGFPFGKVLATRKDNPAITIGKGSVSSLRHNDQDELALVQIDGALNPGNSGGPVVDSRGRLVGVAVATIKGSSGIGLAIPARELQQMLGGRAGTYQLQAAPAGADALDVAVKLDIIDPLNKVKDVTLYYQANDPALGGPAAGKKEFAGLPATRALNLPVVQYAAEGTIRVPLAGKDRVHLTFQTVVRSHAGGNWASAVRAHQLSKRSPPTEVAQKPTPAQVQPPPLVAPAGNEVDQLLADLKAGQLPAGRACDRLAQLQPNQRRAEVVAALEPLLKSSYLFNRAAAVKALAVWGGKDSVPVIAKMLEDSNAAVRWPTLEALGRLKDARGAEAVAALLFKDRDAVFAGNALVAMGPVAEKAVLKCLQSTSWGARHQACRVLKEIGTHTSLEALRKVAAGDESGIVRLGAQDAINAITNRKNG